MCIYSEAAETVLDSQSKIYGVIKMASIAQACGWRVNDALKIVEAENKVDSFSRLLSNIEAELGGVAVVASKLAVIRFISEKERRGLKLEKGVKEHFMREVYS